MCVSGFDSKQYGGKEIAAVTMSHDKTGRRRSEPEEQVKTAGQQGFAVVAIRAVMLSGPFVLCWTFRAH
jgi:hypothetical protein